MQKLKKQEKNNNDVIIIKKYLQDLISVPIINITKENHNHFNITTNHDEKDFFIYKNSQNHFVQSQATIRTKDILDNLHKNQSFVDYENNHKLNLDNKKQNDIIYFYLKKFQQLYFMYQSRFNLKSQDFSQVKISTYNDDVDNSKDWYDFYYNYIIQKFAENNNMVELKIFVDIIINNKKINDIKIYNKNTKQDYTKQEIIKLLICFGLDIQSYTKEANKLFNG